MIRHHQDSLLLRYAQREVSHETAATTRYLVCTDSVSHTADSCSVPSGTPYEPVGSPFHHTDFLLSRRLRHCIEQ